MDARERARRGNVASAIGIACNLLLATTKGVVGILGGSVSIVADATNNLMDAAANVVTLVGFKVAGRPADAGHPFGHGRMEYVAGLGVAILVLLAGVDLLRESISRIVEHTPASYTPLTIPLLALSVCIKLWMAYYNHRVGTKIASQALEAASKDAGYDAIATTAILVGTLVSTHTGLLLDGPLGLGVGLFVIWGGISLLRETIDPLLGKTPDPKLVERVRRRILSYSRVLGTHDLMVHDYGPDRLFASAHVEMAAEENPLRTHETIDRIERDIRTEEGMAIVLHYDPIVTHTEGKSDLRTQVLDAVTNVDPRLTIHDLRRARINGRDVLTFDCVRPEECELDDVELKGRIEHEIKTVLPHTDCHITFDVGFVSPEHELAE